MENPSRTASFLALTETRRRILREQLDHILPASGRFVWEVGCGHGHFLNAYAQANPAELCIGVDITSDRIERANRKRDRARLTNLHFLHAEARLFLDLLPFSVTISRLFLLFPDPWPKLRHHKHRIMQSGFLSAAARRADESARLFFRTDHVPYFNDSKVIVTNHPDWSLTDEAWPFEYETVFQSRAPSHHSLVARIAGPRP